MNMTTLRKLSHPLGRITAFVRPYEHEFNVAITP
jgi:hypothetical protein